MPTGKLQVLEVDGKVLPESLAIARFVAKEAGESKMITDAAAKAGGEYSSSGLRETSCLQNQHR